MPRSGEFSATRIAAGGMRKRGKSQTTDEDMTGRAIETYVSFVDRPVLDPLPPAKAERREKQIRKAFREMFSAMEEDDRTGRRMATALRQQELTPQRPPRTHEVLVNIFMDRSVRMLRRLSAAAPAEVLRDALATPSDIGGVASLLSDLAPLDVDLSDMDPFVEALARGVATKRDLLREAGGGLTTGRVAELLGISRQAVDKRRTRNALLAVPNGSGQYLYPACQFTNTGVVPHLAEVLQAFGVGDSWTRLSVLLSPAPALDDQTPIEALRRGDFERAVTIAGEIGEQGG